MAEHPNYAEALMIVVLLYGLMYEKLLMAAIYIRMLITMYSGTRK